MKIKLFVSSMIMVFIVSCETNKSISHLPENEANSSKGNFDEHLKGKWTLEYMSPVNGKDVKQLYKIQKPYLNFVDGTKVAGNNGCNNVSGGYSANENTIKFETDKFASTRMFCEGVDEQAFLNRLGSINRYDIIDNGNKLVLITGDIVSMTFVKTKK